MHVACHRRTREFTGESRLKFGCTRARAYLDRDEIWIGEQPSPQSDASIGEMENSPQRARRPPV